MAEQFTLSKSMIQSMQKLRGFTMVELLVVVAILAILTTVAAPSFVQQIRAASMTSGVNTFLSDMRYGRGEAVRRGGGVVMCRSDDPEAVAPTCGSGSGPGGNGWVSGWIIFHDLNNNGSKDASEPLLRVQAPLTSIDSILESGGGGGSSTKFLYTATGRMANTSSATSLTFGGGNFTATQQRVLCVNVGGRARIAGDGNSSCSTDR